jgi:hypothetical protein
MRSDTTISLWDSYCQSEYELGARNISEDARGRWYINATIKVAKKPTAATGRVRKSVGIDLGMKDFAATSDGEVIRLDRHYRRLEFDLAKAHRARKKDRVRALHAKIKTSWKDGRGVYDHRYINAAWDILAAGRRRLAEGIPVLFAPCAAAEG